MVSSAETLWPQQWQSTFRFDVFNISATAPVAVSSGLAIPGITFGILPIGFYLYSAYWVLFSTIILWGAWNKRKVDLLLSCPDR
jgi:hypothetical protein